MGTGAHRVLIRAGLKRVEVLLVFAPLLTSGVSLAAVNRHEGESALEAVAAGDRP